MSWYEVAGLLTLLAFAGIGVGVANPLFRGDASPQDTDTGTPPADQEGDASDEEDAHRQSLSDPEPVNKLVQFLDGFKAAGDDPFDLPRVTVQGDGFGGATGLTELTTASAAIVRGTVATQEYFGESGRLGLVEQFFCYSVMTIQISEVIEGDIKGEAVVVNEGCPTLRGETPVLQQFSWDPPLQLGHEYVLFLMPGDDSVWKESAFPEGHKEAGAHYHLGDPAAQYEVADGQLSVNEFTPQWARGLDGKTVLDFKSYLDDPAKLPAAPPQSAHDDKNPS